MMGNKKLHPKYGYIIGGRAERRLKDRMARDEGANTYISWLNKQGALERKPYYIKLKFIPKEKRRQWWGAYGEMGIYAAKGCCLWILEKGLLNTWIRKSTWTRCLNGNLDFYGTMGHGMAKWEKTALKDETIKSELKKREGE